jgi:hypothetical protein
MGFFVTPSHLVVVGLVGLLLLAAVLPPYWIIFRKAGFSPWLSLFTLVPGIKFIVLWVVALSWKPTPPQKP